MDGWVLDRLGVESSAGARTRRVWRDRDTTVRALRSAIQIAMRLLLRGYNRFEVVGRENLPAG
jgi:hypothetical protein